MPVKHLRELGWSVMGFFYRHNIHPFTECMKREQTLLDYSETIDLQVIRQKDYDLEGFMRSVVYRESDRCRYCYHDRLKSTALMARRGKFDAFSSTLLYSKFQQHDMIRAIGESAGKEAGVPFFYHDFREYWKAGIEESKRLGLYRQSYCGCIFSEKERYFKNKSSRKSEIGDRNVYE
jgi:predicted adenine nucleotide alpha hydrolase (AANH) superfamily ATPase